jgi:hypothetical protein
MTTCEIIIILILILIFYRTAKKEGLSERPDEHKAQKFAEEVMTNKPAMHKYDTARRNFGWMDPVVYESLRTTIKTGGFDKEKIKQTILSGQ